MNKSTFKTAVYITVFLLSNAAFSQQSEYIIGKLLDAKTQEPIAFASIRIKDRALGVISNTDGSFKIPLKYKGYGDIIEISSMGYQTQEILIQDFSIYDINNVRLQPAILELQEVIISAKKKRKREPTARQIVRKAIKAIPENYPITPFSTVGYYRDYQIDNGEYVNLNEAILEVFDKGFKVVDTSSTRTLIYDYSQNLGFKIDSLSSKPYNYLKRNKIIDNAYLFGYGGNEFTILKVHDAIRNYELNTFDFINGVKAGDILNNHFFKKQMNTYLDNQSLYVLQLERNKGDYRAIGKLYIAKNDFAIHKLDYAVYDKTKSVKNKNLRKNGINAQLIYEVVTEYKRNMNNKMYLNYISFHNAFQLRQPPKFRLKKMTLNMARQHFVLTFNNEIGLDNSEKYENYKGYYRGKKIKFERLVVFGSEVLLFPRLKTNAEMEMWKELVIAGENDNLSQNILNFEVTNIRDVEGNLVNERILKNYNQFREFFVQELKLNPVEPIRPLYMNKDKPIFEGQPIVKPDNFDDYWMNTPLKTNK